jgi:hypothetical protein
MSLQLSRTKPRQLQYAAGGLREDLKLIELDEKLLDAIKNDDYVAWLGSCTECTVGGLREDLKLIKSGEKLLDAIRNDVCVDGDCAPAQRAPYTAGQTASLAYAQ